MSWVSLYWPALPRSATPAVEGRRVEQGSRGLVVASRLRSVRNDDVQTRCNGRGSSFIEAGDSIGHSPACMPASGRWRSDADGPEATTDQGVASSIPTAPFE